MIKRNAKLHLERESRKTGKTWTAGDVIFPEKKPCKNVCAGGREGCYFCLT